MHTLTAETLQVHILDFSAANKKLTQALNQSKTKITDDESFHQKLPNYYFGAQYCALVDINNRFFLVQPDGITIAPQINNIKDPVLLFELDVFEEFPDKQATVPITTADLNAYDIETLKTGQIVSLRHFMRENFNSSKQNAFNVNELLMYVNSPTERNKYLMI